MKITSRAILSTAALLVLLAGAKWMTAEAPPRAAPEVMMFSPAPDTLPLQAREEAVGLCALNRASGTLEGEVVGVIRPPGDAPARYEVRAGDGSGRVVHMRAEAVMLDLCERAVRTTPGGTPIRVQSRS
jgi:hypothetical protein